MDRALVMLVAALLLAPLAAAAGDAAAGEEMARRWCAECHLIGSAPAATVIDGAPPFTAIANDPEKDGAYLRTWLFDPPPPMPKLELSRREIEDLVAYIESLKAE